MYMKRHETLSHPNSHPDVRSWYHFSALAKGSPKPLGRRSRTPALRITTATALRRPGECELRSEVPSTLKNFSGFTGRTSRVVGFIPTCVIQGNPTFYEHFRLWEAVSVVSWSFPTALGRTFEVPTKKHGWHQDSFEEVLWVLFLHIHSPSRVRSRCSCRTLFEPFV